MTIIAAMVGFTVGWVVGWFGGAFHTLDSVQDYFRRSGWTEQDVEALR